MLFFIAVIVLYIIPGIICITAVCHQIKTEYKNKSFYVKNLPFPLVCFVGSLFPVVNLLLLHEYLDEFGQCTGLNKPWDQFINIELYSSNVWDKALDHKVYIPKEKEND